MKTLERVIKELAEPGEKLRIFCGAGISYHSGVPLAIPFLSHILDGFGLTKKDKAKLLLKGGQLAMPFELFFDTFLKRPEDFQLLDVFKLGQPNTTHHFIAQCQQLGKCDEIYTTNFDTHIETAFKRLHRQLTPYVREEEFGAAVTDKGVPKLIKLHGSIDDTLSIRTTLSSIARRTLSAERVKIIDHLFLTKDKDARILVMGYSCSDYFDIVERLNNIRGSAAMIYFVDHQPIEQLKDVIVEKIALKAPFQHFKGYRIQVDTDVFVAWLWTAMGGDTKTAATKTGWPEIVVDWLNGQVDNQRKYTIAARLFYNIEEYGTSLKYLKKAAKYIRRKDKLAYSRLLINMGVMHFHLNDLPKANQQYEAALRLLTGSSYYYETASLLTNFALNLYKQDPANKPQALSYLEQTLKIVDEHDFEQAPICQAGALTNLGHIHEYENDEATALDYYLQALAIDTDIKGDKIGEIELNRYIARIYESKGNKTLAAQHLKRANLLANPFHKKIDTNYDATKR